MFLFVVAIILAIIGVGALFAVPAIKRRNEGKWRGDQLPLGVPIISGIVALALGLGAFFWSATYKQDEGESNVLRSFTGKVVEVDSTPGLSMKAPWVKAIPFDIRNNQINYESLSFSDKNGTSGDINVSLTYSLKAEQVDSIYKEYKKQDKFETELVAKDVAAALRSVTPNFSNVEMMTKPGDVSAAMLDHLEKRWADWGVTGVQVTLGKPNYSPTITERLENLTAEQTRAEEAKAATVTAEEKAKQRLVEAKAESEANDLIDGSLTDGVLENRRIEMLKSVGEKGNLIITDGEAQPLLNVDTKK